MRYKIIKDGEVVNTILAEPDFIEGYCAENGFSFEAEDMELTAMLPAEITV